MPPKKIILIDLDDTIAANGQRIQKRMIEKFNKDIKYDEREEFEGTDQTTEDAVREIMNEEGFFANLEPIPGAVQAIKEMDQIYDVRFCTAPLRTPHPCIKEKYDWIALHFGKEWIRKIIIVKDKTYIRGDYLIDDRKQEGNLTPTWTQIYFTQSHNKTLPGPRIDDWSEWKQVLRRHKHHHMIKKSTIFLSSIFLSFILAFIIQSY